MGVRCFVISSRWRMRPRSRVGEVRAQGGVEVEDDGSDVRRADGDHAEEPMSPSSKECDAFIQDEETGEAAREER